MPNIEEELNLGYIVDIIFARSIPFPPLTNRIRLNQGKYRAHFHTQVLLKINAKNRIYLAEYIIPFHILVFARYKCEIQNKQAKYREVSHVLALLNIDAISNVQKLKIDLKVIKSKGLMVCL